MESPLCRVSVPSGSLAILDMELMRQWPETSPLVIGGLPTDRQLTLVCDNKIVLECQQGVTVTSSEVVGSVDLRESSILLLADLEILSEWQHEHSLDGLADFTFAGADAERVAQISGAERLDESHWGWRDVALQEAILRSTEVEMLCEESSPLTLSFTPHSHSSQLLKQLADKDAGTIEIDGVSLCGIRMPGGITIVSCDLDQQKIPVNIRIITDKLS